MLSYWLLGRRVRTPNQDVQGRYKERLQPLPFAPKRHQHGHRPLRPPSIYFRAGTDDYTGHLGEQGCGVGKEGG
jgi:hypothetical protein